ncbi:hypothetical protein ACFC26_17530 [Kitasatospora purpeofusca]|uniref:hypothetical protein n=1 Tax=Kitasatospora purpeofusca TaxID=67352 RepID=UPI0035D82838
MTERHDPGEQIEVAPEHLLELLRIVDDSTLDPSTAAAVADLTASALTQPLDAGAWQVPAGAAFVFATVVDPVTALGLDELEPRTDEHPAVRAHEELLQAIAEQAPLTTAAVDAVLDAQVAIVASRLGVERQSALPTVDGTGTAAAEERTGSV